jgi:hypothetical protein
LSAAAVQGWVLAVTATLGPLLGLLLGLFKYFNYKTKRDRRAAVGAFFSATVEALASDNEVRRMVAAVLLRRFFDQKTEQGEVGTPYREETIEVIAGMIRETQPERLQKVLADGLRYARDLRGADLQRCKLRNSYLGRKGGDEFSVDLSNADLYEADCSGASFKAAIAVGTIFYRATLERTVFTEANLEGADFRSTKLSGAKFDGARISGAMFEGAEGIPVEVARLLDEKHVDLTDTIVPTGSGTR